MSYLRELMRDSEVAVRTRLLGDEEVLAKGRCADITTTGDLDSAGAAWTFVMVTDRHVHWVPNIMQLEATCSLDLDAVRSCSEIRWRHRSAMAMFHPPLVRQHLAPNGRHRNWHYVAMDLIVGPLSETILGFSRPTTEVTEALRDQLAIRDVVVRTLESSDHLPESTM